MTDQYNSKEHLCIVYENLHATLKLFWQIIMVSTFSYATREFSQKLIEAIHSFSDAINNLFSIHTLCYIVFVLLFIRVFYGDSRMLDMHYKENPKIRGIEETIIRYSPRRVFIDITLLTAHSILFIIISLTIISPISFSVAITTFLVINATWLLLVHHFHGPGDFNKYLGMTDNKPLQIWYTNNFISAAASSTLIFFYFKGVSWTDTLLGFIQCVFIINSCIDFGLTFKFYAPDLSHPIETRRREGAIFQKNL